MDVVGAVHEAVARDLGDDRCGGDRGARGVAVDDRPLLVAELGHREAVDEAQAVRASDPCQGVAQRGEVRVVQAARVDAAHAAGHDVDAHRRAQDDRVELVAGLGVVLLGVVQGRERADLADAERLDVEEHGSGDERAGETSAPGLVGARDPPHAEATVELEEAPACVALVPPPAARLRARVRGGRGDHVGALVGDCRHHGLGGGLCHDGHHRNGRSGGSSRIAARRTEAAVRSTPAGAAPDM
jgi:hypothetical protein